ncbi:MAG: AAA family ATPase [Algicola sp.]|nr:AAA family ATPase [Algicola sp.]
MKYPLGVQDFSKIIKRGALYVDKTAMILELIEQNEVVFLSRPRRFGKSVLISTLAALFGGQKALFDGLAISQSDYDFAEHPVVEFNFSRVDVTQADDLKQYIINTTNA